MKPSYDVVIVGGSSAGTYFARRMSEKGLSVLIIEKDKEETLGSNYDVFHIGKTEFDRFNIPKVTPGDGIYCFEHNQSYMFSAYGNYPKFDSVEVVGLHKSKYMQKLACWAMEAGTEIEFGASFDELIYSDDKISGVRFTKDGTQFEVSCKLCADCSGKSAVVRHSLPDNYGIEKFELTEKDLFFVNLRYIKFDEPQEFKWRKSHFWFMYKTWIAPSDDSADAILGIGSSNSFEEGEPVYQSFLKNNKIPSFSVVKTELGTTPYHRALYSFVSDGFIALGDAASLTKPNNGEGVTAAMVLADVAADVAGTVLKSGTYPTKESLWQINKKYTQVQGKEFAMLLGVFTQGVCHSMKANEYFFKYDTVFAQKIVGDGDLNVADIVRIIYRMITGITSGNVQRKELGQILTGAFNGVKLGLHYAKYPDSPTKFDEWVKKSEKLWAKTGKLADYTNLSVYEE